MVCWSDGAKYDTVNSKDPDGADVLGLQPGTHCEAHFQRKVFGVEIVSAGQL